MFAEEGRSYWVINEHPYSGISRSKGDPPWNTASSQPLPCLTQRRATHFTGAEKSRETHPHGSPRSPSSSILPCSPARCSGSPDALGMLQAHTCLRTFAPAKYVLGLECSSLECLLDTNLSFSVEASLATISKTVKKKKTHIACILFPIFVIVNHYSLPYYASLCINLVYCFLSPLTRMSVCACSTQQTFFSFHPRNTSSVWKSAQQQICVEWEKAWTTSDQRRCWSHENNCVSTFAFPSEAGRITWRWQSFSNWMMPMLVQPCKY